MHYLIKLRMQFTILYWLFSRDRVLNRKPYSTRSSLTGTKQFAPNWDIWMVPLFLIVY